MHLEVTAQLSSIKANTSIALMPMHMLKSIAVVSYTVGKNSITINDNSESSSIELEITNMTKSNGEFHGQFKATISYDEGTAVIRGMATFWLAAD